MRCAVHGAAIPLAWAASAWAQCSPQWLDGFPSPGVFLGGSGTTDLEAYVVSGEINRVVITQVDDCCSENNLHSAVVVLNGEVVTPAEAASWGRVKGIYR